MAAYGGILCEEQLLCPICLDLFNLPVSTPCGHNFCKDCIQGYWESAKRSQCPICKQKFSRRPEFKVNTLISGLVSQFKSLKKKHEYEASAADQHSSRKDEVSCSRHHVVDTFMKNHLVNPTKKMKESVCKKYKKLQGLFCNTDHTYVCQNAKVEDFCLHLIREINQTLQLSRENTEREIQESLRVFGKLLHIVQRGQADLVEEISAIQRQRESKASELIVNLEQEIDDLRQRCTDDPLYGIQAFSALPATKGRTDMCLERAAFVGTLSRAVRRVARQLEETVKAEMNSLYETEIQRAQEYAVDVTLDPNTAHPKLVLSENAKEVHHSDVALSLPDNPERFYPGVSVLGKEGFSSGRFYYEVQVNGKTEWDIGVGLETVNRKGGNTLNPESGYWALGMRKDQSYWALNSIPICVPLVEKLQTVGVYVDVEQGQVSFYNVDSSSHIYSFTGYSFTQSLFPYFNPRRNHNGTNSAPLIISPVSV